MKNYVLLKFVTYVFVGVLLFCVQLCRATIMESNYENERGETVRGLTVTGSFSSAEESDFQEQLRRSPANLCLDHINSEELIRVLNLVIDNSDNVIGLTFTGNVIDESAAEVIARLIVGNRTITDLVFMSNVITPENLQKIISAIGSNANTAVTRLVLCEYDYNTILAVANLLRENRTVSQLELTDIDDNGVIAITDSLRDNQHVTHIKLNGAIGNEGTAAIISMLQTNRSITHLGLSCIMGVDNVIAIMRAVVTNPVITEIDLHTYDVSSDSIKSIMSMLVDNMTLQKISLDLDENSQKIVELIVERNKLIADCIRRIGQLNMRIPTDNILPSPTQMANARLLNDVLQQRQDRQRGVINITENDIVYGGDERFRGLPAAVLVQINRIRHHQTQILDLLHDDIRERPNLLHVDDVNQVRFATTMSSTF